MSDFRYNLHVHNNHPLMALSKLPPLGRLSKRKGVFSLKSSQDDLLLYTRSLLIRSYRGAIHAF